MLAGGGDPRGGCTLAEATVALLVAGVLTACLAAALTVIGRLAARHERLSTEAETERVVATILGGELRTLTAADAAFDSDSVRLRAFRGVGVVCRADGDDLVVRYGGLRLPEPGKDSVLLLWPAGESSHALTAVSGSASCPVTGDAALRLTVSGQAGVQPAVALVFETGAYSIVARAFRYRRGAGGRQPLSEATLSDPGSGLDGVRLEGTPALMAVATLLQPGARSGLQSGTEPLVVRLVMPQGASRPAALEP